MKKIGRMGSAGGASVLLALCVLLAGCRHKVKAVPAQATLAPALPLSTLADAFPPPEIPPTPLPKIGPPVTEPVAPRPKPHKMERRRPRRREVIEHKIPVEQHPSVAAAPTTLSDMTPIGQLSAAGGSTNTPRRAAILDEITAVENGLKRVHRPLNRGQRKTASQIETFLTKARAALNQEDLDGANTLATKAKVLLDELTKR